MEIALYTSLLGQLIALPFVYCFSPKNNPSISEMIENNKPFKYAYYFYSTTFIISSLATFGQLFYWLVIHPISHSI